MGDEQGAGSLLQAPTQRTNPLACSLVSFSRTFYPEDSYALPTRLFSRLKCPSRPPTPNPVPLCPIPEVESQDSLLPAPGLSQRPLAGCLISCVTHEAFGTNLFGTPYLYIRLSFSRTGP